MTSGGVSAAAWVETSLALALAVTASVRRKTYDASRKLAWSLINSCIPSHAYVTPCLEMACSLLDMFKEKSERICSIGEIRGTQLHG